ncbi:MAG TPA: hypothetical protein VFA11_10600 [Acidimicrobiales bacterium]|nr:hypothetical protein [Acidimicrobiales bacterium]
MRIARIRTAVLTGSAGALLAGGLLGAAMADTPSVPSCVASGAVPAAAPLTGTISLQGQSPAGSATVTADSADGITVCAGPASAPTPPPLPSPPGVPGLPTPPSAP